jgi:hypothetical protein
MGIAGIAGLPSDVGAASLPFQIFLHTYPWESLVTGPISPIDMNPLVINAFCAGTVQMIRPSVEQRATVCASMVISCTFYITDMLFLSGIIKSEVAHYF